MPIPRPRWNGEKPSPPRGPGAASRPATATVQVQAVGVEPIARFVALACEADAYMGRLTPEQTATLPGHACDGIATLRQAIRLLTDNKLIRQES
jgi:hypothetical protein